MIRVFLGSALPIVALGAAAAFLGPDLVTGPRGEPLVLAAPDASQLKQARFEGEGCATLLYDEDIPAESRPDPLAGTRIVAFALRSGAHDVEVAIEDFPGGATSPRQTILLLFDETGELVAAGSPEALRLAPAEAAPVGDCAAVPEHARTGPI